MWVCKTCRAFCLGQKVVLCLPYNSWLLRMITIFIVIENLENHDVVAFPNKHVYYIWRTNFEQALCSTKTFSKKYCLTHFTSMRKKKKIS